MVDLQNGKKSTLFNSLKTINRWSIANNQLPSVEDIKYLHIYDFDNTLFNSPLPNPKLWNSPTVGFLQSPDKFQAGGWWHNSRLLAATGEGIDIEELRAWKGWWNEKVVDLVKLSMQQKDVLTVLLTGRSESGFSAIIKRMVKSKKLEFDIICLKPIVGPNNERFSSTMIFKKVFLEYLVETYKKSEEIRIYEDRIKHVKAFRDFFVEYNRTQLAKPTRGKIMAEVIQVADGLTQLDPVVEVAEVQRLINDNNLNISLGSHIGRRRSLQIKKIVFYTGYLISSDDTQRLLTLAHIPPNVPDIEIKFLANNILITPRPPSSSILEKVGGMGSKVTWEVIGTAIFENKIWAARVRPVPDTKKYFTENPVPIVVLALRKGARAIDAGLIQNWNPVSINKQYVFDSVVGEKALLRIEEEDLAEDEYEGVFPTRTLKRKYAPEDDSPRQRTRPHSDQPTNIKSIHQQNHGSGRNGRGSSRAGAQRSYRGSGSGSIRAGRGRGRNTGPNYIYRSLDDVDRANLNSGYNTTVAYEDLSPLQRQYQETQQIV